MRNLLSIKQRIAASIFTHNAQRSREEAVPSLSGPVVELYHWRPLEGHHNFGDHLSKIIVSKALSDRELFLEQAVTRQARLLAIGSILHFANNGDTVWGSGVNGKVPIESHRFQYLDVRSVRGPKTRDFLMERGIAVPEIYGDPALLLSSLLPSLKSTRMDRRAIFVPNLHDEKIYSTLDRISPRQPWNVCVRHITSSEFVVSSSLHGLVVAESYGIPARYVRLSDTENLFKYEDYVLGTGRKGLEFARSIDEALEMGGMPPATFSPDAMIRAFPFDLWA